METEVIMFTILTMGFFSMAVGTADFSDQYSEEELDEYGLSQDDLSFSPDLPVAEEIEFDIEDDAEDSTGVRFDDWNETDDPDFESDKVASNKDANESAFILYRVPDEAEQFTFEVTRYGILEDSGVTIRGFITPPDEPDSDDNEFEYSLKGENNFERTADGNYITVEFEEGAEDAKLYDITLKDEIERGAVETTGLYLQSAGETLSSLVTITTGLPQSLSWIAVILTTILSVAVVIVVVS